MKTSILSVAAVLLAAATTVQAASSTWLGTNSPAWTNAVNWSPGIPATGDDVVIADTTGFGNSLNLTDSRTIGSITFGTTGTRTTTFQITNNVAANSLTFTNGLIANGAIGAVINFFRIPTIIDADQTWSIGGTPGAVTADFGIGVTPRANGTQTPFTLNANLTKTGTGQLTFIGANITGNGNLTINQGVVKFNGGSSTTMSASGGGSIVINNGGSLLLFRNSGALTCTKPVALNTGGTLVFGGNSTAGATYGFPLTMNGNVNFSSGGGVASGTPIYLLTGPWTGTASVSGSAVGANIVMLVLSNNITGWTGSFNHAGNAFRIAFSAAAPGNAAVAWSLNNAGAILETYGATNVQLGSVGGSSGTLRNSDPANQPATVTVGALNTSTTFGAVMADNTASLSLVKVGTGTLTLTGNNTFSGGTVISNGTVLLQGATASSGSANVAVRSGATFGGSSGTAGGGVTLDAGGTLRLPGGIGAAPLTAGGLTFGASSTDTTTTTVDLFSSGKAACTGGLTVNGTNIINLIGGVPSVGVYDVITYSGAIGGSGFAGFKLGSLQPGVAANLQDSGTAIQVNVTATGQPGVWVGNLLSQWNLQGGLEWKGLTSGTPQAYLDLYPVFFDDTAASFTVNITENVTPAIVNVSNTTAYTFSGTSGIVGSAGLTKGGPGTLTILNSNSYSGGTFITNGTVQLGNGGTSGSIGGPVNNNGVLIFNRSDALTVNEISGAGSIEQRGTGITTVGGANSYTGLAIIATGTLAAGSGSALGVIDSGTVVSNAATLDVNSQNLGAEPVNAQGAGVGGAGALVNNGPGDQTSAFRYVTLDGPATFGGARRWDIRVPTVANDPNGGTDAFLHGNGYNLTKVNSNIVGFISAGDTALADIDIQGGTLTFSRSSFMGDSSKKVTVRPGATLQFHRTSEFFNPNILNKVVLMTNATMAIEANGLANNQFAGPVTLSDSNVFNLPAATGLNLTGPVNGSGSATVIGPGTLVVSGNASYTGGTTLNGAVLQVDGTLGSGAQALAITAPSTVGGNGTINYSVTVPAGSVLSPGAHSSVSVPGTTLGGLTINNTLTLQAGCSNIFEINKDAGTNDTVRGLTSVTMAGTLVLQNVGSTAYAPGDNFKLFAAGSYSGGFSTIVPPTPALELIWLTNSLTVNGTLGVAVLPNPVPLTVLSASSLVSTNVNVLFSAELDPASAQNPANYLMSTSNQVVTATLLNPTNVLLGLDSPITNASYRLKVQSVQDLAYIPNVVATTNVPGVAIGFDETFRMGNITNGSAFAWGTNSQIKVYADGSDIFGTQDNGEFVYKYVTGDFDVSVRLESLLITDPAAKAGIMARDVTDPTFPLFADRFYMVAAFSPDPTRNDNFTQYREDSGGTAVAPAAPRPAATYPNNWLRLKRTGSVMQGYSGPNGLAWTPMTFVDSSTNAAGPYPATIRLGLAVTSHNAAQTTEAVFSNFGNASEGVLLNASASGSDLVLTWPTGTGATLQATPALNPPVTWTNVPGSDTTNLIQFPIGSANSYFRLVK